jgi:hypothetical protein
MPPAPAKAFDKVFVVALYHQQDELFLSSTTMYSRRNLPASPIGNGFACHQTRLNAMLSGGVGAAAGQLVQVGEKLKDEPLKPAPY